MEQLISILAPMPISEPFYGFPLGRISKVGNVSGRCSRWQTTGTFMPFPRSTSACRSKPTICSALRRFIIREPFSAHAGA
jgi:hypothetical protein